MIESRMVPIGANTFIIRVDSYHDGEVKGLVEGATLPGQVPFSSLIGLILMLDSALDEAEGSGPSKPAISRTFVPNVELEILFRKNSSWQGRFRWLEAGKEATFSSVLELIIMFELMFGE